MFGQVHSLFSLIGEGPPAPSRAPADIVEWNLVRSPREDFFEKSSGQILPSGPLSEGSPQGYAKRIEGYAPKPIYCFFLRVLLALVHGALFPRTQVERI